MSTTTTATALRSQMSTLNAGQPTESLVAAWISLHGTLSTTTGESRRPLVLAMDSVEAELRRRGMTDDQMDVLDWAATMNETEQ